MSPKLSPDVADAIAATIVASDERGWNRGFEAGYKSGSDAAVAIAQPIVTALEAEIKRLRGMLPATAALQLIEGGKGAPDA